MLNNEYKISIKSVFIFLFIFLVISTLSSCRLQKANNYGYSNLKSEDSILFKIKSVDDTIDIVSEGVNYLYIGWEKCPWCQEYVPFYNNLLKENGIDTLYYFSPYDIKGYVEKEVEGKISIDYKTEEYKTLVNWILSFDQELTKNYLKINSITASNNEVFELPWIYVPRLYKIENGTIVDVIGTLDNHNKDENGNVMSLSEGQIDILSTKINNLVNN